MKKIIFATINSFVGLPPIKQLVLFLRDDYKLLAIQCEIGNFENFFIAKNITHKKVLSYETATAFNNQSIGQKLHKYIKLVSHFINYYTFRNNENTKIITIDVFTTVLALLLKRKKTTIIYLQYEMIEPGLLNKFDKILFRNLINHSDKIDIIITPENNRAVYLQQLLPKSDKSSFFTLPNSNNTKFDIFEKISKKSSKVVTHIGAVGLNHHIKNYLDAISKMDESQYEFRFIGLLTSDVQSLIESYHRKNIIIIGQVKHSELEKYYKETDVGMILYKDVSLNHRFCAPNKLYEYWSYGIPVIGDELPGLQSVFRDESLGCLVDMSDPKLIREGISKIAVKNNSSLILQYFNNHYKLDNYLYQLKNKLEELET